MTYSLRLLAGRYRKTNEGAGFTLICEDGFGTRHLDVSNALWSEILAEREAPAAYREILRLAELRPRTTADQGNRLAMPREALDWKKLG